jgi:hypothetical protein
MLQLQVPALIKIREGITVNLSNSVSQAIEHKLPQRKLKDGAKAKCEAEKRQPKDDDYEEYAQMDTVSFWFVGGTSLSYRVSEEITQEDFNRISTTLTELTYKGKNERITSDKPNPKKA